MLGICSDFLILRLIARRAGLRAIAGRLGVESCSAGFLFFVFLALFIVFA